MCFQTAAVVLSSINLFRLEYKNLKPELKFNINH